MKSGKRIQKEEENGICNMLPLPPQKERTNSRIYRNTCLLGEQARQLKRKINYLTGNPCIHMHVNTHTQKHIHLRQLITYEKIFNSLIISKMQKKKLK